MIWAQGLLCFALWIAYGVFQTRRSSEVRRWAFGIPRTRRVLMGGGLFLGGAALLAGTLGLIAAGQGMTQAGLVPWAWALVAVVGLGYAHTQVLATALLVSLAQEAVTRERTQTSDPTEPQKSTSDEAPSP